MLASLANLAVDKPPQFSTYANGPQCPNVTNATGRWARGEIKRSASSSTTVVCQYSVMCSHQVGPRRTISPSKCGYRAISNPRRSRWCNVFIGSMSIEHICKFNTINHVKYHRNIWSSLTICFGCVQVMFFHSCILFGGIPEVPKRSDPQVPPVIFHQSSTNQHKVSPTMQIPVRFCGLFHNRNVWSPISAARSVRKYTAIA